VRKTLSTLFDLNYYTVFLSGTDIIIFPSTKSRLWFNILQMQLLCQSFAKERGNMDVDSLIEEIIWGQIGKKRVYVQKW